MATNYKKMVILHLYNGHKPSISFYHAKWPNFKGQIYFYHAKWPQSIQKLSLFYNGFPRVQLASFYSSFSNHRFPRVYTPDVVVGLKKGYFTFDPVIAMAK